MLRLDITPVVCEEFVVGERTYIQRYNVVKVGSELLVFRESWIPRPHLFKPITTPNTHTMSLTVGELLHDDGRWNWDKVAECLWPIDHNILNRINIGRATDDEIFGLAL